MSDREYSRYRSRSRERRRAHSPDAGGGRQNRDKDRSGGRRRSPAEKFSSRHSRSRSRSKSADRRRSSSRSPRRTNGHSDLRSTSRPKCLGVFGLSIFTTEKQIYSIFEKYGPLDRVQVIIDSKTGKSRGYCFVYFANHEDAKIARDNCNGMEVDERRIRVDFSITQRAHEPTPGEYMGSRPRALYRNRARMDRRPQRRRTPSPQYRDRRRRSRSNSPRTRRYR